MISFSLRPLGTAIGAVAVLGVTACAPQQSAQPASAAPATQMSLGAPSSGMAAPTATPGTSMSGMQGHDMSSMGGMQGHNMSGMNMQQMMAHCAEMRQQRPQGARMSPSMQQMMAQCAEMDRAHGTTPRR